MFRTRVDKTLSELCHNASEDDDLLMNVLQSKWPFIHKCFDSLEINREHSMGKLKSILQHSIYLQDVNLFRLNSAKRLFRTQYIKWIFMCKFLCDFRMPTKTNGFQTSIQRVLFYVHLVKLYFVYEDMQQTKFTAGC